MLLLRINSGNVIVSPHFSQRQLLIQAGGDMLMMTKKHLIVLSVFGATICSLYATKTDFARATTLFNNGRFSELKSFGDSIRLANPGTPDYKIDSLCEIASRVQQDFSLSEPKAEAQIRAKIGTFTLGDKNRWENNNWLEYKIIDGQKRYFNRAVSNLRLRLNQYNDSLNHRPAPIDSLSAFRLRHTAQAIAQTTQAGSLSAPTRFTLSYSISVKPDMVPAGETVRCWLPYPKENRARQHHIKLLSTSQKDYKISPDTCGHRSVYMV